VKINSRAKGKTGEREVAGIFMVWWAPVEPGCRFVSTPLSGGFSTPAMRGDMKVAGDLCTNAKKWPFTVEVKRREGWNLKRLFAGKPSPVWAWWRQCVRAAREEGRVPLLMFRKNGDTEWMLMVPRAAFPGVPCFDNWAAAPLNVDVASCAPMVTTWDAFKHSTKLSGIIKACRAFELPPDINPGSSTNRPRRQLRQPPLPLPGLNLPPQPGASVSAGLSQEQKLRAVAEHLATPSSPKRRRVLASSEDKSPNERLAELNSKYGPVAPASGRAPAAQTKPSASSGGSRASRRVTGSTLAAGSSAKAAGAKRAAASRKPSVAKGTGTPSPSTPT
jgi:hypothetical protein